MDKVTNLPSVGNIEIESIDLPANEKDTKDIDLDRSYDDDIRSLLQRQVCHEFDNERLYQAMALWCSHHGYVETAKFFDKHTAEERKHGNDFIDHMLSRHMPVKPPKPKIQPEFKNLESILKASIAREKETTKMISELYFEAMSKNDIAVTIATKYMSEQLEEERLFMSLYNLFKLSGGNKIDFEMEVLKLKDKKPKYLINL